MVYFASSDTGRIRQLNEDFCFATAKPIGCLPNLFVVCDGMGGHNAGEYASEFTIRRMLEELRSIEPIDPFDAFSRSIAAANHMVHQTSVKDIDKTGMGTTLVCATIVNKVLFVANVGDSRLYVRDDKGFRQVTRDHSYVEEMVRKGILNRSEARHHRDRNKITRAIGVFEDVQIDYFDLDVTDHMQILLCTDGLTSMLEDQEIDRLISTGGDVQVKVERLIRAANVHGGKDNITVILVDTGE